MTTYNTGNPLGSAVAKDLYDNAQNFAHLSNDKENESWKDRFGMERLTWHGMEKRYQEKISSMGWNLMDSFQEGNTLTEADQALRWKLPDGDGEYYRWDGAFPKTVPAGSSPESTGGIGQGVWIGVGDASLRSDLTNLVGYTNDSTHDKIRNVTKDDNFIVSTWNIQSFSVIVNRYNREVRDWQRFYDLFNFILKSGSHIIGMQECYDGPFARMSNLESPPYRSGYFGIAEIDSANTTFGYNSGIYFLSGLKLNSSISKVFVDEGGYKRVITRSIVTHNNVGDIVLYNVHSGWFEAVNNDISSFIISDLQSLGIEKSIIAGDFNHDNMDWFSPYTSYGFKIVNENQYNTKNSDDGTEWFIDNILYKGFVLNSVDVFNPDLSLSDHKMLTANFSGE
ncbi:endonuclease/exonuclease/phosphatase family protein [Escherichia coli]|uniref:tail fiber/spike domain-containing protein n=1 Tax=Escherichia coli TaxID=562 RepID=UPI00189CD259|nr:endonuclease/exonuclease/phosphatase family protein [Escherichia coli]